MAHRNYDKILWILLAAFLFRVFAQLTQRFVYLPVLPPFSEWDSGYMPYPALFLTQLTIAAGLIVVVLRVRSGAMIPRRRLGVGLLIFGIVYFLVMAVRFGIAVAGVSDATFFRLYVPAFFHLGLSGFVMIVGKYHIRESRAAAP
jgi:hypothetical protein